MNLDVSYTPNHPDSSRTLKNGHDSTHGATKNEPDSATVGLRFRPRPQSTTIHPECFKRFKIVVALPGRFPNRQDLWCTKKVKSGGTGAPLFFYRCTGKIYRWTAKYYRCTAIFYRYTAIFTGGLLNLPVHR